MPNHNVCTFGPPRPVPLGPKQLKTITTCISFTRGSLDAILGLITLEYATTMQNTPPKKNRTTVINRQFKTLLFEKYKPSFDSCLASGRSPSFLCIKQKKIMTKNAQPIQNIVLVHGAFADGSGWKGLYTILTKAGYNVTVVQNPLTSFEDDVTATKVALDKQDGPGNHPNVAALVYVAAFQPDQGESALHWFQTAPPAPENGVLAPDEKGIVYYDKTKYHAGFCAVIATEDKSINPAIQRIMYKRSNSITIELKESHCIFISQPEAVSKVIIKASQEAAR